jgi:heme/copper-type cytochrome/quinol oxidase subunit 1
MTAWMWALVDFFYVYNAVKTDAKGRPLTITKRDKKWAKILYIGTIIAFVLAVAFWIVLASFIATQVPNGLNQGDNPTGSQGYQEFIKELEKQQQSQSY